MANVYYNLDQHKSIKNRYRRRRLLLLILIIIIVLISGGAVYVWQKSTTQAAKPVVIQPLTKTVYNGSPEHLIQNSVFSFKSTADWQFSPEESSLNKYVFFTQENNLIEYELDIIFNRSLDNQSVNYIIPLTVSNNRMQPVGISSRCGDSVKQSSGSLPPVTMNMQFEGANYICAVRGSGEKAAAALVGGTYDIALQNSHGQNQILNFAFVNDGSSYFGQIFEEVLQSFKLN